MELRAHRLVIEVVHGGEFMDKLKNRRSFLKLSSTFAGLVAFAPKRALAQTELRTVAVPVPSRFSRRPTTEPKPTGYFPILQGATSSTETNLRVLVPADRTYTYVVVNPDGSKRRIAPLTREGVATATKLIDAIFIDQLAPGTEYSLEISHDGRLIDLRYFRTYSTDQSNIGTKLRVALISCMNDRYETDQADMWAAVASSLPELMIFNGDCCYVDQRASGTIEGMWDRHVTTRSMLDVFRWDRLVPILATWDDHDTGENDSNSTNPRILPAGVYFTAMFGSQNVVGLNRGAGRNFSFDLGGVRWLLLDDRSGKKTGDTTSEVFSQQDENWIQEQIAKSPYPVVMVNGTQFFGGYLIGADSVEKYAPDQLQRLCDSVKRADVPVILVSGDVHFSELMELEPELFGYKSYEITSSAIHSRTFPGMQYRSYNPRRLTSTSRYNFVALEIESKSKTELEFDLSCVGAYGEEYFAHQASVVKP